MADKPKCGILDQILGNAIVCSDTFQDSITKSGQAQIQTVADNADKYYGPDSATAQVAHQVAQSEEAQVPGDTTAIVEAVENSSLGSVFNADCGSGPGVDLSFFGGPCITYTLLKEIALGVGAALVIGALLYAFAVVSPFIPKGRK